MIGLVKRNQDLVNRLVYKMIPKSFDLLINLSFADSFLKDYINDGMVTSDGYTENCAIVATLKKDDITFYEKGNSIFVCYRLDRIKLNSVTSIRNERDLESAVWIRPDSFNLWYTRKNNIDYDSYTFNVQDLYDTEEYKHFSDMMDSLLNTSDYNITFKGDPTYMNLAEINLSRGAVYYFPKNSWKSKRESMSISNIVNSRSNMHISLGFDRDTDLRLDYKGKYKDIVGFAYVKHRKIYKF